MNNQIKLIFVLIFLLLLNSACILSEEENSKRQLFHYTAYDSLGTAMIRGTMHINFTDSGDIRGQWEFFEVQQTTYQGPQVGQGQLVGNFSENQIWINLNPQNADNNVMLQGELHKKEISGRWSWITFIGPTSSGNFDAVEK